MLPRPAVRRAGLSLMSSSVPHIKNRLIDLNDRLFAQLERLSDEGISADDLAKEIQRTDAEVKVSAQIIDTANVAFASAKLIVEAGGMEFPALGLLPICRQGHFLALLTDGEPDRRFARRNAC